MNNSCSNNVSRKPLHLRIRVHKGPDYRFVKSLLRDLTLNTVCESAGCPNIFKCFEAKTATFLLLGDICTRACTFCNVNRGIPHPPDEDEPTRVAEAVAKLGLKYAVITSVTRDDLSDGGASIFKETLLEIKKRSSQCGTEVLVPDFAGNTTSLKMVIDASPDVLNHNIETVPRLYPAVRPAADYRRSLELLSIAKEMGLRGRTKSGLMVGLGEQRHELVQTFRDLHAHSCDAVTIGQYLAPSKHHFPIARYYDPAEFEELKAIANEIGIKYVESGPLVRSSYNAANLFG